MTGALLMIGLAQTGPIISNATCNLTAELGNMLFNLATLLLVGYVTKVTQRLDKEARNGGE